MSNTLLEKPKMSLTNLYEDPEGFVPIPRNVSKITDTFTKASSFILVNKLFDFFSSKGKEYWVFTMDELAKKCKKSESTVREALREVAAKKALIVEDIPNIGKLIMINKQKNKDFLKQYLAGEVSINIPFKLKNRGSVGTTPSTDNQDQQVEDIKLPEQILTPQNHTETTDINNLQESPIDLILKDPILKDHHHIDQVTETEVKKAEPEIKVTEVNNAVEFLKNSKEEKEQEEIKKARESFIKPLKTESDNKTSNTKKEVPAVGAGVDNSKKDVDKLKDLVKLACSVKFNGALLDNLNESIVKKAIEAYYDKFGMKNTTEMVNNQVSWFTFRDEEFDPTKNTPASVYINCLKENRKQPTKSAQELARIENEKYLAEYLPIVEIWQGHTTDIKNGSQAKNTIITNMGKVLADIKKCLHLNVSEKIEVTDIDLQNAEKLKATFVEKFKKSKEFMSFTVFTEFFQKSINDLNLAGAA